MELTEETLAALERDGPRYNAVATVMRERALLEARAADRALARRDGRRPALVGIPYGAKDLLAARGAPTTWGAPPYRHRVIDADATAVGKLRRAGAVLAAKLAMVELAGGGGYRYPSASLQGPGRNPWDLGRWSGGSSSGSAAAVAAGLVPFSLGSETSGSIGTPSAYCGVTGLRPTYGLVSRAGAMALSWTLDKIGPMAHSADDCALVLEGMAGPDAADPTSSGRRFRRLDAREASAAVGRVRVGYDGAELVQFGSDAARAAIERGVAEFVRAIGRPTLSCAIPGEFPYGAMVTTVYAAEGATIFADLIEGERFEELVDGRQKAGLRAALDIRARDYLQAMRLRTRVQAAFRALFERVDVILTAGRAITATPLDHPLDAPAPGTPGAPATLASPWGSAPRAAPSATARGAAGNAALIPAGNLAGLPGIFFPCGLGTDGLPVGLQLVGPPFSEGLLVALVARYQRETDHHRQRPRDARAGAAARASGPATSRSA